MVDKAMGKVHISIISIFAIVLLAGCTPQQNHVSLQPEEAIFVNKCNSCHLLPKVDSQAKEEWEAIIRNHEEKRVRLSDSERTMLIQYLSKAEDGDKD